MATLSWELGQAMRWLRRNQRISLLAVVTLALYGADYTMAELYEVARDLRDELGALPLVAQETCAHRARIRQAVPDDRGRRRPCGGGRWTVADAARKTRWSCRKLLFRWVWK